MQGINSQFVTGFGIEKILFPINQKKVDSNPFGLESELYTQMSSKRCTVEFKEQCA
jgi:hypothetical protein